MSKKEKPESEVNIGEIIDMPLEDFKKELIAQRVNIGTINNLILWFESIYAELSGRRTAIMDLVLKGIRARDDAEVVKSLEGLYAEMTKIEQKVVYLKEVRDNLLVL